LGISGVGNREWLRDLRLKAGQKKTSGGSLLNLFKLSAAPQLPPPDAHFYLKRWKRA
jgi:hypothetical protein